MLYFTEQHRQPFLSSNHSSYNSPSSPMASDFSIALPNDKAHVIITTISFSLLTFTELIKDHCYPLIMLFR